MAPLSTFSLPLRELPAGYGWDERESLALSSNVTFTTALDKRDIFLGQQCCIVCGRPGLVEHCRIIPKLFERYTFFIRFLPTTRKVVHINYLKIPNQSEYHGKVVGLDIHDLHAPFPSLFIIHEMQVRGHRPFLPIEPLIDGISWQNCQTTREGPPPDTNNPESPTMQFQPQTVNTEGEPSGRYQITLNDDVINEILAATRAMPSWKACQMEDTRWNGTAEENIQKYVSTIGTEDQSTPSTE
ncbi:hypothetical protein BDN72DRAFT_869994 [Pluteus cervinus]|uniref:Uncharacterized protein n=1 Tax=Pluteus cervinus TaxID=181527 RepID=A0ACD3B1G1_9AGAR|nr:hypothetical protein BDN72DRAFT_869994 [Pluteus cervinus]